MINTDRIFWGEPLVLEGWVVAGRVPWTWGRVPEPLPQTSAPSYQVDFPALNKFNDYVRLLVTLQGQLGEYDNDLAQT